MDGLHITPADAVSFLAILAAVAVIHDAYKALCAPLWTAISDLEERISRLERSQEWEATPLANEVTEENDDESSEEDGEKSGEEDGEDKEKDESSDSSQEDEELIDEEKEEDVDEKDESSEAEEKDDKKAEAEEKRRVTRSITLRKQIQKAMSKAKSTDHGSYYNFNTGKTITKLGAHRIKKGLYSFYETRTPEGKIDLAVCGTNDASFRTSLVQLGITPTNKVSSKPSPIRKDSRMKLPA